MKGRKPQSREEKAAKGETRPSRVNDEEPDLPEAEASGPPKELKGLGLRLWKDHYETLRAAAALRAPDVPLFIRWCKLQTRMETVEKRLKGGNDQAERLLLNMESLSLRISAELGLTPVSRTRVKTGMKAPVEKPKHDRFFGGLRGIVGGKS